MEPPRSGIARLALAVLNTAVGLGAIGGGLSEVASAIAGRRASRRSEAESGPA